VINFIVDCLNILEEYLPVLQQHYFHMTSEQSYAGGSKGL